MNPLLSVDAITKEFSGVRVLDQVSIQLNQGDILGVIGENGAGKSTFMKILAGIYTPTSGSVSIEGVEHHIHNPIKARDLGISMVPQEFNLVDSLKVFENVFLGYEKNKRLLLNKRSMIQETAKALQRLETDVDPEGTSEHLSVAHKQMVEIAKALIHRSRILILDEPTTVLNSTEIHTLFELLRKLTTEGVTILFISHKLHEIKALCNKILILRDGLPVYSGETAHLSEQDIAKQMVGRELNQIFPTKTDTSGDTCLEVKNLTIPGLLNNISFSIQSGEILGFAGLVGSGRTETAEAIMGLRNYTEGTIRLRGKKVSINSPRDAIRHNMAYLSEDRKEKGLTLNFSIPPNITLISLGVYIRRLLISKREEKAAAKKYITSFNIKAANMLGELRFLSGGNQQKVYLAKWMDTKPELLILDEPTRGIDVNAKVEIYQFIRTLADSGIACLIISSELEEVIGLCNRVIVMKEGRITGEITENLREEEIMYYATGIKEDIAL